MSDEKPKAPNGWVLTHKAPDGAQVVFIPGGKGAAVVAGADFEPYIVYPDGRTEKVQFN